MDATEETQSGTTDWTAWFSESASTARINARTTCEAARGCRPPSPPVIGDPQAHERSPDDAERYRAIP